MLLLSQKLSILLGLILFIVPINGLLSFPSFFSSRMVLQRAPLQAYIFGTSDASAKISILLNGQVVVSGSADSNGKFRLGITAQEAGGPHQVSVLNLNSGERVDFVDVYFGDVWLCSGQSNMEMNTVMTYNATEEIEDSINYPEIRVFAIKKNTSYDPLDDVESLIPGQWQLSSPSSIGNSETYTYFSSVCYLFGRENYKKTKIPTGLISSAWGGTIIQAWSSQESLANCRSVAATKPNLNIVLEDTPILLNQPDPNTESVLFNAMIHPLFGLSLKGMIWYQGEQNAGQPDFYRCQFREMILDYRARFDNDKFSFYFVQLAPYNGGGLLPEFRIAQTSVLDLPGVGMGTAIDTWDPDSIYGEIHPRNKQIPALRLSLAAQYFDYGLDVDPFGPILSTASTIESGSNWEITLTFESTTLHLSGTEKCTTCCENSPFEIQTENGWNLINDASVSGNVVRLLAPIGNGKPIGVRYAWADIPQCGLYDTNNLIAPPFVNNF